ncbi:MAG: sulfatase-like hydrolase/transferase [Clostridia bacterium]
MKKPNIIFILSDDQGAWALGSAGNNDIITPNLDKLAQNGVRYENFFCASPVCSPARASIATGEIPSCHGVIDWLSGGNADTSKYPYMSDHPHFKKADKPIEYLENHPLYIAELAKNGYRCALSGKWHLGNTPQAKEGFEKWFTIFGGGCNYFNPDFFEDGHFINSTEYVTDAITNKAIDFLHEFTQDETPFYLSVHYTAPHSPWNREEHKEEYLSLYDNCEFNATPFLPVHKNQIASCPVGDTVEHRRENLTGYYAAITAMDENIGRILDELEKSGKADETIVIFTADNGMNMGHHGIWGKGNGTYPQNMYDSSVKIPFIISAPFINQKGTVNNKLRSHLDLFPTLLDVANCDYTLNEKQGGRSFYTELLGEDLGDKTIAIGSEYGQVRMIRTKTKKLIIDLISNNHLYFDIENDPNEDVNLYSDEKYQDEIKSMRNDLDTWFTKYSSEKCDATQYVVTGRGQDDFCYKENAFQPQHIFYYDKIAKNK